MRTTRFAAGPISARHATERDVQRRRFCTLAQACVLLGALAGSVLAVSVARAADVEATGTLAPKPTGTEWWRLRPAQSVIEVPKSEGAALPETRKAVRMVYPAPYEAR